MVWQKLLGSTGRHVPSRARSELQPDRIALSILCQLTHSKDVHLALCGEYFGGVDPDWQTVLTFTPTRRSPYNSFGTRSGRAQQTAPT